MSIRYIVLPTLMALAGFVMTAQAVTVQSPDDVLDDGSAYLWVEAEDVIELGGGEPEVASVGFILVDKDNPIQTITEVDGNEVINGGLDVLPEDTNASGGAAIFHQLGGGGNAKWEVQFANPGTYYLYMHYSFFNRDTNTNYGNEDSIYVPPAFNADSRGDWIGHVGVDFDGNEKVGDSDRDGWMPLGKDIVSAGDVQTHNSTDENFWEGQFHWAYMDVAVDMDENNNYLGDFGHAIQYEVSEADVGTVLTFEISGREQYGVIDGLLFSTSNELLDFYDQEQLDGFFLNLGGSVVGDFNGNGVLDPEDIDLLSAEVRSPTGDAGFDLNGDGAVNDSDRLEWIEGLANTYVGDSNFDREFGSADLVAAFTPGKYETGEAATWTEGDWDGNGFFDSADFVAALTRGGYEVGPRAATAAVPEPSSLLLMLVGLAALGRCRK